MMTLQASLAAVATDLTVEESSIPAAVYRTLARKIAINSADWITFRAK